MWGRTLVIRKCCHTKNGVRRKKNKGYKYHYLQKFEDKSISRMIKVLIEQFSVVKYER